LSNLQISTKIFIPTSGRPTKQKTAQRLADAGITFTLVTNKGESKLVKAEYGWTNVVEYPHKNIKEIRQYVLDMVPKGKLVMLDDDLEIYARQPDNKWPKATNTELRRLFSTVGTMLDTYAHGGVCDKFMSQHRPTTYQRNQRYYHIDAFNTALFPNPKPRYRCEGSEDMDMNLQLLKLGRPNFLLTQWAHADKAWAEGGCSVWRTPTSSELIQRKLAALHPDVIKLVQPKRDMKSHGNPSFSMRINWRKAAEIGGAKTQ